MLCVTLAALAFESAAIAGPGDHILAGDAVITPGIDIGIEHRTNAFRAEAAPVPVDQLRVSPMLQVSAQGADVDFNLGGQSEILYTLQSRGFRTNLDQLNPFTANLDLNVLKRQALGFRVYDSAGLRNNVTEAGQNDNPFHTQFRNELRGEAIVRIGAPIEIRPAFQWDFDEYRVPRSGTVDNVRNFNSRNAFGPRLEAKWTFFPRTAAVLEASWMMNRWADNTVGSVSGVPGENLGQVLAIPDSDHVKVMSGIRGRFTERLVVIAMAGYGVGLYNADSVEDSEGVDVDMDAVGIDGLLFLLQGRYELAPGKKIRIGYRKDFLDSWFTNYLAVNQVYAGLDSRFGPRVGVNGEVGVRFEGYAGEVARSDVLSNAKLDTTYYVQDWMSVSGGVWWTQRASPGNDAKGIAAEPAIGFDDFNIHLLMNFTY